MFSSYRIPPPARPPAAPRFMPGMDGVQHVCANPAPPEQAFTFPAIGRCGCVLVDYPTGDPRCDWQRWPVCGQCVAPTPVAQRIREA